jgi:hypothetical protein
MDKVLDLVNSITDLALKWGVKTVTDAEAKKKAQEKEQYGNARALGAACVPADCFVPCQCFTHTAHVRYVQVQSSSEH